MGGCYRWCRCSYRHAVAVAVAVAAVLLLSCGGGEGGIWISQTVASAQAVEFYNEDDSEDSKDVQQQLLPLHCLLHSSN
jgi:hypothetical protein